MDISKKLFINQIIKILCDGSRQVDHLTLSLDGGILTGEFKSENGDLEVSIPESEIYDIIEKERIANEDIKDYILMNILRGRLRKKAIRKPIDDLNSYLGELKQILKK